MSIESQENEMARLAKKSGLRIDKTFKESMSAKKTGRPVFNEMLQYIGKNKGCVVFAWKADRLSRNVIDGGRIIELLEKGCIQEIRTIDKIATDNSTDKFMLLLDFGVGKKYTDDLSQNVKRGLAEKIRRKEYPGARPIGYVTDPKSKMMVIDSEPASFIRRAFHLYATENYATERIADTLYDEGFRSRLGNKVGKSTIYRMLTNPIYTGLFLWKGQTHEGIHEPIVPFSLFDAVEKRLAPKKHLRRDQTTRVFTYRGFLVCGECGLKVTAEVKKGHTYYRCTKSRGAKKCSQCYTREETLEKALGVELAKIRFDDEILDLIVDASKEKLASKKQVEEETEARLTRLLAEVKKRKNSLIDKFIGDEIPKDIYDAKFSELTKEEAHIEEQLENVKGFRAGLGEEIETAVRFVKTAQSLFVKGAPETRREVIEILSSNIGIKDRKIASFSLNEPFTWLREDVESMEAEIGAFEPKKGTIDGSDKTKTEASASARSVVLGRKGSNLRMGASKAPALPLGYSPVIVFFSHQNLHMSRRVGMPYRLATPQ